MLPLFPDVMGRRLHLIDLLPDALPCARVNLHTNRMAPLIVMWAGHVGSCADKRQKKVMMERYYDILPLEPDWNCMLDTTGYYAADFHGVVEKELIVLS